MNLILSLKLSNFNLCINQLFIIIIKLNHIVFIGKLDEYFVIYLKIQLIKSKICLGITFGIDY